MQADRPRKYSLSFSLLSIWSKPPLPLCRQVHPKPPNMSFAFNFSPLTETKHHSIYFCVNSTQHLQPNSYILSIWYMPGTITGFENVIITESSIYNPWLPDAQFCVFHNSTCYGLNSAPPSNSCAELLTPQDFEDRALKNVVKIK